MEIDQNTKPSCKYPWAKALYICSDFTQKHGITVEELRLKDSTRTFSRLRQELARRLKKETSLSWREISEIVGRENYRVKLGSKTGIKNSLSPK